MKSIDLFFAQPWLLLLAVPAVTFVLLAPRLLRREKEKSRTDRAAAILRAAAVALLVDKGYSEKYGARHLRRLIQTDVEDAVASVIIEGYQNAVTAVSLTAENGALKLESH